MFARFVRPLLPTILCRWEIWSGLNKCENMYQVLAKKDYPHLKKKPNLCHRTDFEADL